MIDDTDSFLPYKIALYFFFCSSKFSSSTSMIAELRILCLNSRIFFWFSKLPPYKVEPLSVKINSLNELTNFSSIFNHVSISTDIENRHFGFQVWLSFVLASIPLIYSRHIILRQKRSQAFYIRPSVHVLLVLVLFQVGVHEWFVYRHMGTPRNDVPKPISSPRYLTYGNLLSSPSKFNPIPWPGQANCWRVSARLP